MNIFAKLFFLVTFPLVVLGCGPSAEETEMIRQLNDEVVRLKAEIDEVKNGAPRLLNKAQVEIDSGNYVQAKSTLQDLIKRHSGTAEANIATPILADVEGKISEAERVKKQEEEKLKEVERIALEKAEKNLIKKVDEIEGITWISHKNAPTYGKYLALYFGTKNGSASIYPVRLKIQYTSDDWLFVRGVTIKVDEQVFELPSLEFKRDNGSGSIWEWSDEPVTDHVMLRAILNAKRVVIRFHGNQYYSDYTLLPNEQVAMRETYAAWKKYGGVD